MFHYFNPRPDHHTEQDPRIERFMVRAAALSHWYSRDQVATALMSDGATSEEAFLALAAGTILNSRNDDENDVTLPDLRR